MKIGILLGSFDPIHMGHLHMAVEALNHVDKVLFVPAIHNPWKDAPKVSFDKRCMMLQLAIEEIENAEMSVVELKSHEPYYTSDTLKLLKEKYPNDQLVLIVGDDLDIENWHEGKWILEHFSRVVINRKDGFNISSTKIRELVAKGTQLYPYAPKIVSQYIKWYKLYK